MARETDPLLPIREDETLSQGAGSVSIRSAKSDETTDDTSSDGGATGNDDNTVLDTIVESIVEATETIAENITTGFAEATEAVADEVHDIKEIVMEELHEAEQGELYFTDMALTRNFSILPTDIQTLAHGHADTYAETTTDTEDVGEFNKPELASSQGIPLSAYLGLASAVMSLSAIGPLLAREKGATGCMRIFWRMLGTSFVLLPFAIHDIRRTGLPSLSMAQWTTFLLSSISYITMAIGFVLALSYTTVGNAMILANSQALMLLVGNLMVGAPVTSFEIVGALGAFVGAIFCSRDSSEGSEGGPAGMTLYGDLLALLAGVGGVGYLIFAKTTRLHLTMFVFTFLTMITGSLMTLALQIFVLHETVTWDRDVNTGAFGFLRLESDRLPIEIAIVLICNLCGTMGYIRAMAFFDSLVISVAGLLEPVVAVLLACVLGVGVLPGWKGWVGNVLVGLGTLAVIYPSSKKKAPATH